MIKSIIVNCRNVVAEFCVDMKTSYEIAVYHIIDDDYAMTSRNSPMTSTTSS